MKEYEDNESGRNVNKSPGKEVEMVVTRSGTIMTFCDAKTGALRTKEGDENGSMYKEGGRLEGLREDDWT